jgi:TrpR-related protein YerC/YecD
MEVGSKIRDPLVDKLFEAILSLETQEECYRFFEDLCTVGEVKALAQRLEVAKMLDENRTYVAIGEKTGASTATISRVKRFLHYGAGGYRLVLERLARLANSHL